MFKDFDSWNSKKKNISVNLKNLFFKEREIWWVSLGCNIGYEIDGKGEFFARPVIILKKYNKFSFLGLPLTTSCKRNRYIIGIGVINSKEAAVNMSQIKNIDSRRLLSKISTLSIEVFKQVKENTSHVNFG